ncbi:hypothetical protein J6836_09825 [Providencia sp. R33]|uniref:hypothetical protein n=1 Tax=Providencia sp. R33 TaxID=2828763 RepID=UPI001C5A5F2E|nr:hypothetical protein [Providencia sp. R33]QXX84633.1 hypothetical protein J6836_09825 [Providencia sp. R33]
MKIKNVRFLGLFDKLNYDLDFSNFEINILTGPNGYGKTIILKSISNLLNLNLNFFEKLTFDEFSISFDYLSLTLKKCEDLHIEIEKGSTKETLIFERNPKDIEISRSSIISRMEIHWNEMKSISNSRDSVTEKLKEYLMDYSVLFIKDQRIQVYVDKKNEITLISLAKDLKEKINSAIEDYNRISQELDATFPIRLFDYQIRPSYAMIEERLKGLKLIRHDYIKFGFLDNSVNTGFDTHGMESSRKQENAHVLELYLYDSLNKYSAFEDLTKKNKFILEVLK